MKDNKGPTLYSKKTKLIIALCTLLVAAVTVLCIVLIANGKEGENAETTGTTAVTEEAPPYQMADTGVVTDAPATSGQDSAEEPPETSENTETADSGTVPDRSDDTSIPDGTEKETVTDDTSAPDRPENGVELGDGIILVSIAPYSGAFVEDGSDEQVENIVSAVVRNSGDNAIQLLEFAVGTDNGDAVFSATTILPNTSVLVLEKNRMPYPGGDKFGSARITQIGRFIEEPSFYSDKFEVMGADGNILVKNIGSEDVTGKVVVFYKSVKDGRYFGGITYQATLNGGVPAGETVLVNANHFRINDSRLMFVKYD